MRHAGFVAALLAASPAAAEDPPLAPPDPELLVFLGEIAGEDPEFVAFVATREAQRALKDAEKNAEKDANDEPKEDDDE